MRIVRCIQAGILLVAATFCTDMPIYGDVGLTSTAQAKTFWTKKRVHGRWVHGHFPKKATKHSRSSIHASSSRSAHRLAKDERENARDVEDAKQIVPNASQAQIPLAEVPQVPLAEVPPRPAKINPGTATPVVLSDPVEYEKLRTALIKKAEALRNGEGPPR
jgi:hypothetical protein